MSKIMEIYLLEELEYMLESFSYKHLSDSGDKRDVIRVVRIINDVKTELEEELDYDNED